MKDILDKVESVVKKGKELGADEVIAKTTLGRYRQTRFSNNDVDISVAWNDYITDVALAWNKRLVATQIKDFKGIKATMEQLFRLAKVSKENPMYGGIAHGKFKYQKNVADKALRDLENPSQYIKQSIDSARRESGPKTNTGGSLFTKFEEVYLVSSEGPVCQDERSAIELSIRAFSQIDASGHAVECSSNLKNFEPERAGKKAGEIARLARNPRSAEAGKYDVILDPLFWGSLLGNYASMFSAFSVMVQMSVFTNKIGEKVGTDLVTLTDRPAEYSVSNRTFDDEGVPTKGTTVIDQGILKTYLHNTSTAKTYNAETTGNAGLVSPSAWNIEMDPGNIRKDDMIMDLKRGLHLTNTWYTRFQNYKTGDFSTIPRDGIFFIENGEIKQSLKNIRLSDNALRILANITHVSRERNHVHWWDADLPALCPYVLVENVQMTKPV
jgi:PmbA protein